MRILVYGAGVLGCNLANDFFRAGKDVALLARGMWADTLQEHGLRIKHKFKIRETVSKIRIVKELEADDGYDVIFVAVRYTQLDGVIQTLHANRSKNIVFIGNNARPSHYAGLLQDKNVMFGFASSAGYRDERRINSVDLKKITIGQLSTSKPNDHLIHAIFEGTGYRVTYEPNMEDYLLCHAAYVLPNVFACYFSDGDLRKIKLDKPYLNRVVDATLEGYRAIEKAGHRILPKEDEHYETEKFRKNLLLFLKLMCATSLGKICIADHAMNAVDEMTALDRDFRHFMDAAEAEYPAWSALESGLGGRYIGKD